MFEENTDEINGKDVIYGCVMGEGLSGASCEQCKKG